MTHVLHHISHHATQEQHEGEMLWHARVVDWWVIVGKEGKGERRGRGGRGGRGERWGGRGEGGSYEGGEGEEGCGESGKTTSYIIIVE